MWGSLPSPTIHYAAFGASGAAGCSAGFVPSSGLFSVRKYSKKCTLAGVFFIRVGVNNDNMGMPFVKDCYLVSPTTIFTMAPYEFLVLRWSSYT
jgi:hypothetical protein